MADKINRGIVTFLFSLMIWPLRGWMIAWYWNWFVAESFGISAISVAHGMAFSVVVGMSRISSQYALEKEHSKLYYAFVDVLLILLAWPLGWLWHALWVALNVPALLSGVPS